MQVSDLKAEELLKEAFKRFDESSLKLQDKYESLLRETECLRREIEEKNIELKRSEKLAMLGETAAALAHEVRNPLGSIKLFVSMLQKDLSANPEATLIIENIHLSISTLDNVVSNILRFSKNENFQFAALNLHSLIQEQVSHYSLLDNHKIDFALKLSAAPFIMGNEHSLRQVFHNLILNSAQAMKNSGHLEIETFDQNGAVRIEIRDSGPGIDAKILSRVFDPFVTSKNEGTGLGLAVVNQIICQHNGKVTAENINRPGNSGARFTLILPRMQNIGGEQ